MAEILVVDDEPGIRELMREILEEEGYEVRMAENGTRARAALDDNVPDLVLLDIWMPDVDGVTLLKEWRSQGRLTMPVVMMSGIWLMAQCTPCAACPNSAVILICFIF